MPGAALIPNFLQNLFRDGVLSASLIPVRAWCPARPRRGDRVARSVLAILAIVTSLLVLAGVTFTPFRGPGCDGLHGRKTRIDITLVRILFPGVGLLVGSAAIACDLNTHGKFFSSAPPALWNTIIGALIWHRATAGRLAVAAAWGAVMAALQVLAQLPQVIRDVVGWLRTRLRRTLRCAKSSPRRFRHPEPRRHTGERVHRRLHRQLVGQRPLAASPTPSSYMPFR
jgi:putative peptidoglycan lipid II flippase